MINSGISSRNNSKNNNFKIQLKRNRNLDKLLGSIRIWNINNKTNKNNSNIK